MGEEHIHPVLIALKRELLHLNVVVFLHQQLLYLLSVVLSRHDEESINFSPVDADLFGGLLRSIGGGHGGGGGEVEFLEERDSDGNAEEDVDCRPNHCCRVSLIHNYFN